VSAVRPAPPPRSAESSFRRWPGPPLVGMLTYNAAVALYLAYVGFAGGSSGTLLWPVVVLHVIVTALLTRAATRDTET